MFPNTLQENFYNDNANKYASHNLKKNTPKAKCHNTPTTCNNCYALITLTRKLRHLNTAALTCSFFLQTQQIQRDAFTSSLFPPSGNLPVVHSRLHLRQ